MNNTTASSLLARCVIANSLAKNSALIALLSIKLLIAIIGIPLMMALIRGHYRRLALHANMHLLLYQHYFAVLLLCGTQIGAKIFQIIKFIKYNVDVNANQEDICTAMIDDLYAYESTCTMIGGCELFAIYVTAISLPFIAIERCIATMRYRRYESDGMMMGIVLTIAIWLLSGAFVAIINYDNRFDIPIYYCTIVFNRNFYRYYTIALLLIVAELFALVTLHLLIYANRRKQRAIVSDTQHLSIRYQLSENLRGLSLIYPAVWIHVLTYLPMLVGIDIYLQVNESIDRAVFTIVDESCSFFVIIYAIALPTIIFLIRQRLDKQFRKIAEINGIGSQRIENMQNRHFVELKLAWD